MAKFLGHKYDGKSRCHKNLLGNSSRSFISAGDLVRQKNKSGSYVEEYWSDLKGDSLIGHCRFIKDGKTTFYELLAIVSTPAGIALRMRHLDGAFIGWDEKDEAGDCLLVSMNANEAIFDNSKSEHRVKVTYRRSGAKSLYVAVEDTRDGKTSTYPFEYNLVE
jgi:hypothetical protein